MMTNGADEMPCIRPCHNPLKSRRVEAKTRSMAFIGYVAVSDRASHKAARGLRSVLHRPRLLAISEI